MEYSELERDPQVKPQPVTKSVFQMLLECCQAAAVATSQGSLVLYSTTLWVKNLFLTPSLTSRQSWAIPPCPGTDQQRSQCQPLHFPLQHDNRSPLAVQRSRPSGVRGPCPGLHSPLLPRVPVLPVRGVRALCRGSAHGPALGRTARSRRRGALAGGGGAAPRAS